MKRVNHGFDPVVFGARLKARRREAAMSQKALAKRLAVSQSWISEIETGHRSSLEVGTVYRLCQALRISADYLLGLGEDLPGHLVYERLSLRAAGPLNACPACNEPAGLEYGGGCALALARKETL